MGSQRSASSPTDCPVDGSPTALGSCLRDGQCGFSFVRRDVRNCAVDDQLYVSVRSNLSILSVRNGSLFIGSGVTSRAPPRKHGDPWVRVCNLFGPCGILFCLDLLPPNSSLSAQALYSPHVSR